jgi:cobyrinic acid a,c-diamide synthase
MNAHPPTALPAADRAVPRLLVSAAHKSSGKTTVALGLCAALRARGLTVAPFKKGPDYIDPMWLARASARPCYNLDPYLMPGADLAARFAARSAPADVAVVEGNKGLYDGLALDGSNSNAAVAAALGLPVVLVIDGRGMTRGIAPLILGYQAFDPAVRIAGVILNRLGGARHESKLRAVIEHYTDVPVLGALHEDESIAMVERHLGLMPDNEADDADALVARIGSRIAARVDLDAVLAIAREAGAPAAGAGAAAALAAPPPGRHAGGVRIGIAMDRAFGFYYADDLEALRAAGAVLLPFDTLRDRRPPEADALFFGGGFPETCAEALAANRTMRAAVRAAIEADLPVYAECGGLMYLARAIEVDGRRHEMVGAIAADVHMHPRPVGRGYVALEPTGAAPFAPQSVGAATIRAHEFHYSSLVGLPADTRYAYRVLRGHGIDGRNDGIVHRNLLASYSHLRGGAGSDWARRFAEFAAQRARRRKTAQVVDEPSLEGSLVP